MAPTFSKSSRAKNTLNFSMVRGGTYSKFKVFFARLDFEFRIGAAPNHAVTNEGDGHMRVAEETDRRVLISKTGRRRKFVKDIAPTLRTIQSSVDNRKARHHTHIF